MMILTPFHISLEAINDVPNMTLHSSNSTRETLGWKICLFLKIRITLNSELLLRTRKINIFYFKYLEPSRIQVLILFNFIV